MENHSFPGREVFRQASEGGGHIIVDVSVGRWAHVGLLVITLSSLKLHTEKNVNFDTASSKRANFDEIQFFKTYT